MKKSLISLLTLLGLVGIFTPTKKVDAYGYRYSATVTAGGYRKNAGVVKKTDWTAGAFTPYSGLNRVYVTHRARFMRGGGIASHYVDAYNYRTYSLPYYRNMAISGETYYLAVSLDSGQARRQTTITGLWMP